MSMRSILATSLSAASILALAGPAMAADPYSYPSATPSYTAPAPVLYDWSGAYAGALIGGAWSQFDTAYGVGSRSIDANGFNFGVLGGINTQMNNFVFGVEIDAALSTLDDSAVIAGTPVTATNDWVSTLRGRAGVTFDRYLVYGTAGLAAGNVEISSFAGSESNWELGWTIGAGIEAALSDNFTARAEYLYTDLGEATGTAGGIPFSSEFTSHGIRAGVTYRFR